MPFAKEAFSEEAFCASSSSSEDWCACEREAAGEKSWCEERERKRGRHCQRRRQRKRNASDSLIVFSCCRSNSL